MIRFLTTRDESNGGDRGILEKECGKVVCFQMWIGKRIRKGFKNNWDLKESKKHMMVREFA